MRAMRGFAVVAMMLGMCVAAVGQEEACTIGVGGFDYFGGGISHIGPYTLTVKHAFEQQLADGNVIRGTVRTRAAEDSKGRTVTQNIEGCKRDENGVPSPEVYVRIFDPTTKSMMTWSVTAYDNRVVRVTHSGETVTRPEVSAAVQARRAKIAAMNQAPAKEIKKEDLGTRTFAGVEAQGTRTTRTIPAGEEGNELPLVTVSEVWRSKELGFMTMMEMKDDPRTGRSTNEVEGLIRGEPDEVLFTPPAGYKVVDNKPVEAAEKAEGVAVGK